MSFTVARPSATKFKAIIEGGPQLAKALLALDTKVRQKAAKEALANAGREIADEWAVMVPIGEAPEDPHPGAYQRSLRDQGAVTVRATKNGASGSVRPAVLPELADDDQPRVYAAVLEFGDADRAAQPSARPAFESALPRALRTIGDSLRMVLR